MSDHPQYAVYRVAPKDSASSKKVLDIPFLVHEHHGGHRVVVGLSATGRKLKRQYKPLDTVLRACTSHGGSKAELQKHRGKFYALCFLRKWARDPKTGRMEILGLSPSPFTKQWGQFSPVTEPAKGIFEAYEKKSQSAAPRPATQGGQTSGKAPDVSQEVQPTSRQNQAATVGSLVEHSQAGNVLPKMASETTAVKKMKKRKHANNSSPKSAVSQISSAEEPEAVTKLQADQEEGPPKKKKKALKQEPEAKVEETKAGKKTCRKKKVKKETGRLVEAKREQDEVATELAGVKRKLRKKKEKQKTLMDEIKGLRAQMDTLEKKFEALRAIIFA